MFRVSGRESDTARGKLHLQTKLGPAHASKAYAEILSRCLLCGACEAVCSRQLRITDLVIEARRRHPRLLGLGSLKKSLVESVLKRPGLMTGLAALIPARSGLRLAPDLLAGWPATIGPATDRTGEPQPITGPTVAYFSGCLARYLEPAIAQATGHILNLAGQAMSRPAGQACCGLAYRAAGKVTDALDLARTNIAAFEDNDLPILTSCASCYSHLLTYPRLLADDPDWRDRALAFAGRLREWSSYLVTATDIPGQLALAHRPAEAGPAPLLYHDPCHLRFQCKITTQPRQLLARLPGHALAELPDGPRCCGQGGLFGLLHPELSQAIFARLQAGLDQTGTATVTTTCSGCLLKLGQGLRGKQPAVRVVHPAVLVAQALAQG